MGTLALNTSSGALLLLLRLLLLLLLLLLSSCVFENNDSNVSAFVVVGLTAGCGGWVFAVDVEVDVVEAEAVPVVEVLC